MTGKFDLTLLSVGNDISEVRNQLPSIFQYLDIESVRLDLFDIILEKNKEWEPQNHVKNQKLNDLSVTQISNESQIHEKNDLSHLQFLKGLTTSKIRKKMLIKLVYPKIKELLEELVRILNEQPIKVNPMHVLLIEFIFDMSNHKPLKYKFIDNNIQVESDEKAPYQRISLLDYVETQRHNQNFLYMFTSMLTDEALNIHSYKILTENLSSTDSRYPLHFAFTLSQCSIFKIKEFLDFQMSLFEGDFNEFLEISLLKYRNLFKEEQIFVVNNWISKKQPAIATESRKKDKKTDIGFTEIKGNLSDDEIKLFFSFLYQETNGEEKPFLLQTEVEKLLENGFSLNSIRDPKFSFSIEGSKSLGIIYYSIHCLYMKHGKSRNDKKLIAQFFYDNFKNFSKITFENFMNAINPNPPKTMIFDLFNKGYLLD